MLTDQKMREILKYVWNPKLNLTNAKDIEKLSQFILQIYDLLESRNGSEETLTHFLKTISIQYFNAGVSEAKSVEAAKLIMNWYAPTPMIWTDFGRVKIQISASRLVDQDYFVYQSDTLEKYIAFDYSAQNEILLYPDEFNLPENEKQQLIEAIETLVKPAKLIFDDATITKRIVIDSKYKY